MDATPFQSSDKGEPVDHTQFGALLEEAGFTRNGGEVRPAACLPRRVLRMLGVGWLQGRLRGAAGCSCLPSPFSNALALCLHPLAVPPPPPMHCTHRS